MSLRYYILPLYIQTIVRIVVMFEMLVITQFTTLVPASETGNNIFIPALQIRLRIVTFAPASK